MSWIDKELKRRARSAAAEPPPSGPASRPALESDSAHIAALWHRFESANESLPVELRLALEPNPPSSPADGPRFLAWLRAPNGAGLGRAAEAIRYLWPQGGPGRSRNFWIRWERERGRFIVIQRVGQPFVSAPAVCRFDERRVERMLQSLVTGRRVTIRAVKKKVLGIF